MENPFAVIGAVLFVVDWIIRLVSLVYVPRGRKPTAAMAWLLAIFIIPLVGIILFFIIGSPKLSKRRRGQQQSIDALIESVTTSIDEVPSNLSAVEHERYMPLIQQNKALSKLPAQRGNTITVIDDYQTMINDMIQQIKRAEQYIYIEYYIIAFDATTRPLFDALEIAINRGVNVYVLFDAIGSRKYRGYKKMQRELTRIGAHWRPILPLRFRLNQYNRPDLRNHRKIVVIDDKVGYIGSFNLIDRSYQRKDDIVYDDLSTRMTGPVVRQCAAVFAGDWFSETNEAPGTLIEPIEINKETGTLAQILPSGPAYDHENNLKLFVALLYTAKHRVVITNPYFVPDDALMTAVVGAAMRGVEVIIINSKVKDQWMVGHAQRSYYKELLEAGVTIYLRDAPVLLHSKHITIDDDIAVVGSSNMDIRSFQLNLECVVIAYDKAVVAQLVNVQKKDLAESYKITLAEWKKRKLHKEVLDNIARLTASLQ